MHRCHRFSSSLSKEQCDTILCPHLDQLVVAVPIFLRQPCQQGFILWSPSCIKGVAGNGDHLHDALHQLGAEELAMLHLHFPIGFENLPLIRLPAHFPLWKLQLVIEVNFILVQHVRLHMAPRSCGGVVERIVADLFPFLIPARHLHENSALLINITPTCISHSQFLK